MRTPHLLPAFLAVALTVAALSAASRCARRFEESAVHAVAPQEFLLKTQGAAMQAAAFRQADLLPLYGGSEVVTPNRYDAISVFGNYPQGFAVFPVGKADNTALPILLKLAAVGAELRGKKVAVSVTPISIYQREMLVAENYAGNYSPLHGYELIFSPALSFNLKRGAARRMLDYPETLREAPVLRMAVRGLADNTAAGWRSVLRGAAAGGTSQDGAQVAGPLGDLRLSPRARRVAPGDPPGGEHRLGGTSRSRVRGIIATTPTITRTGSRTFSGTRTTRDLTSGKNLLTADEFKDKLERSREWTDIGLLLRGLNELGAEPLLLSTPIMGKYCDRLGIRAELRKGYYNRLRDLANRYGVPLCMFQEHDADTNFCFDQLGHMNFEGWICYEQALAEFYHGGVR